MKRYVLGFMFDPDREKVLLVEKTSPPWQAGKYNGIGGSIEPNEMAIEAMCREFLEETGIATEIDDWEYKLVMKGAEWEVVVFRAEGPIQLARQMTEKDKPLISWVSKVAENQSIIPNLRWIIPFLCDAENIQAEVAYHSFKEAV